MAYEVTATKKRPATFNELAGQDFVVSTLKNSLDRERIAHAYLFSGPRGVGKTSAARILAKSLNCEKGITSDPCGRCSNCSAISSGSSMDVIEIDGASNTSVNDVRTIKEEVLFAPNSSRYKVYIIDEVHMLSNSAFNALLKTIEEPPPYVVFIFATTEIHKVPATIRSRCQQFNFRLLSIEKIKELLLEAAEEMSVEAENDALLWIAREATGSMRDAYTLFDQIVSFSGGKITLDIIREKLGIIGLEVIDSLVEQIASGNNSSVLEKSHSILMSGVSIDQFVIDLTVYFRSILFIKTGIKKESILGFDHKRYSEKVINTFSLSQLEQSLELLLELHRNLKYSLNRSFELELTLSRLCSIKEYITPEEILKELDSIKYDLLNSSPHSNAHTAPISKHEPGIDIITNSQIESVLNSLKKQKLALSSALEKAAKWELSGNILKLIFNEAYPANFVKSDLNTVKEYLSKILNQHVELEVIVSASELKETGQLDTDDEAKVVQKVFRGEIVKGSKK